MQCTRPIQLHKYNITVPCGKCTSCRLAMASEWAARMIHESEYYDSTSFATFTYSDETLPADLSIDKTVITLLIKRIRKALEPRRIKYYANGEYGEKTGRPHYHAILFGIQPCFHCWSCCKTHMTADKPSGDCEILRKAWPKGIVDLGPLNYLTARYVANYMLKEPPKNISLLNREKPFTLMSKGLGRRYLMDNADTLLKQKSIRIQGVKKRLPKYYADVLKKYADQLGFDVDFTNEERLQELNNHYLGKYSPEDAWKAIQAHRAQTERIQDSLQTLKEPKL